MTSFAICIVLTKAIGRKNNHGMEDISSKESGEPAKRAEVSRPGKMV